MVERKRAKTRTGFLKVVFDTNVLYTQQASDLLRREALELIQKNSNHADLKVEWLLPETVRHERQFQMNQWGEELLPPLQRLERLLGHGLGITKEVIEQRINEAVESQLSNTGLTVLLLDVNRVDWNRLMLDAAYRLPPFQAGPEKGFRDALVVESFTQLVEDSPKSPQSCRVALVTGDKLMTESVNTRIGSASNVRILPSLEELQSLISTLVAEVTLPQLSLSMATVVLPIKSDIPFLTFEEGVWREGGGETIELRFNTPKMAWQAILPALNRRGRGFRR